MYFELERSEMILKEIKSRIYSSIRPINGLFTSLGKEKSETRMPFSDNDLWGEYDEWRWFYAEAVIPPQFEGKTAAICIRTGREDSAATINPQFLMYINGRLKCAMDMNHYECFLTENAVPGEHFTIELEAHAGTQKPDNVWKNKRVQYGRHEMEMSMYIHDYESERLYYNMLPLYETAKMYGSNDMTRVNMENILVNTIRLIDFSSDACYDKSIKHANEYIETEFYGKLDGKSAAYANCVGHTHIDVAWLWDLEQTRRKAVRSFSTVLSLMEEYPEYKFMSGQPQLYEFVKEDEPQLYEKIKERIAEGRWEADGAMWVEADCNLTSGESLIRQIIHGKRFFREEFGKESTVLWLPDVFGYSAALPQILLKCGIKRFVTSKISWNEYNHMPYDTFLWQGIDGSEVFTQFINAACTDPVGADGHKKFFSTYCGEISPECVEGGWRNYQQKKINNETLVSFGYGDGGGGPTRAMLEMNSRMEKGIPGIPRTRITTVREALDRIEKNALSSGKIPKWSGELYLEYHRGTYTSMAKNKRYNRKAEYMMAALEGAERIFGGADPAEFYDMWKVILLNQFHDIIPGSSIKKVYEDSHKQYEELFKRGNAIMEQIFRHAAGNIEKGVVVYNPTGFKRSGAYTIDGETYFAEDVPPWGYKVVEKYRKEKSLIIKDQYLENQYYKIVFDDCYEIKSLYDKHNQRELVRVGERINSLVLYEDRPLKFDAWDINIYYEDKSRHVNDVSKAEVIEDNGICGGFKIERRIQNSVIVQEILIYEDNPRIDFVTKADWKEKHVLLKAEFPVDICAQKATYEIQYGNIERPTHKNTSWDAAKFEVCAHKWCDLSENGYGAALLNDCKYGCDIHDGVMRQTLIKCAADPNPDADQGYHEFTYSFMPHHGTLAQSDVIKQAYFLNCRMYAFEADGKGSSEFSAVSCGEENVIAEVVKAAYDGNGMIVRIYESKGKRTNVSVSFGRKIKNVYECDMEENIISEYNADENAISIIMKPFEIKTIRII